MYLSVRGIDIASVSTMFPIGIRNCSEGVVSFFIFPHSSVKSGNLRCRTCSEFNI